MTSFARAAALAALILPALASASKVRGTVHAPSGKDVAGAVVIVCWTSASGDCDMEAPNSRSAQITSGGASARYEVDGLAPGVYAVIAVLDANGDGGIGPGDLFGTHARPDGSAAPVKPPADKVDVRLLPFGEAPETAAAERAKPGKPIKGGFTGLYIATTRGLLVPGQDNGFVQRGITWLPQREWHAFLPDGRVYVALPPEGLMDVSWWDEACRRAPSFCARYTVEGNAIRIRWETGEEKVLRRDRSGMLMHERVNWTPLAPLDGVKLDGKYVRDIAEERKAWITFTRDGRFTEHQFLYEISWNDGTYRDLTPNERAGGSGRYRLGKATLELRYDDGRVVRTNAYALPGREKKLDQLHFNSYEWRPAR